MAIDLNQLLAGYNPSQYGYTYNNDGAKPTGWYKGDVNANPYGSGTAFEDYLAKAGVGMWDPGNPSYGRIGLTNDQAFQGLYPGATMLGYGSGIQGSDPSLAGTQFFTTANGATPNEQFAAANVWGKDMGDHSSWQNNLIDKGWMLPLALAAGPALGAAGFGSGTNVFDSVFSDAISGAGNASWGVNPRDLADPFTSPDIGEVYDKAINVGGGGSAVNPAGSDFLQNVLSDGSMPSTPGSGKTLPSSTPDLLKAGSSVGTSALAKLLGVSDATAQLLGTAGTTLAGIYGSNKAADTLKGIYDQQRADRAPALSAFNNALTNPDSFYSTAPAMGAADAAARALSVQGNPAWNPGLSAKLAANNLGGYNSYLNNLAGPAFGGQVTQAATGGGIASAQNNLGNTIGGGITAATTPTNDFASILQQLKGMGLNFGVPV